jgi:hypothetical protein
MVATFSSLPQPFPVRATTTTTTTITKTTTHFDQLINANTNSTAIQQLNKNTKSKLD